MSSKHTITLYDLDGRVRPFSTFVWRTHLLLNFKGLSYRTIFVPFPDIEATAKALGANPTSESAPQYTVPVLIDERPGQDTVRLAGTDAIADYLESTYPEPRFFRYSKEEEAQWQDAIARHFTSKIVWMNVVSTQHTLEGPVLDYYLKSRPVLFGKPLEELYNDSKRDETWAAIESGLNDLSNFLDTLPHRKEWLFGTDSPAYADFVLCASFCWTKAIGFEGTWERIKGLNGGKWQRLYERCEKYMPKSLSRL